MIGTILLAIGLVLFVEGLVYALAPHLVEELLEMLKTVPPETLRLMGVAVALSGALLVWVAHSL
ncbi:MAG: DUF2065 domain-containing protein [Pseudomonadota bacterium]